MTCPYCRSDNLTREDFRRWDANAKADGTLMATYHCLTCGSDFYWCKKRGLLKDWDELLATRAEQAYFNGDNED